MNKKLWTFNEKGHVSLDNDGNDFYYSWVNISAGEMNIEDLVKEFLDINDFKEHNVRIKARKGAIFIVLEGDKDDTPNPKIK